MTLLARFALAHFLPSLAVGVAAWLMALGLVRLLDIRSSAGSFCFLSLPVFKSLLIVLGVGTVLPWPAPWLELLDPLALPAAQALPIVLAWTAVALPVDAWRLRQAQQAARRDAHPAAQAEPRLARVFEQVLERYRRQPCPPCDDDLCSAIALGSVPHLLVSGQLRSPLALTGGRDPAIIFPAGLVGCLSDAELAGALAHELAHFTLRRPQWCSAGTLRQLALISPVALLVGEQLRRQEETACDALAVSIVGQPELYAGMLTRSYRFARERAGAPVWDRLSRLPHLLGLKPLLSVRVERLLAAPPPAARWKQARVIRWLGWAALFALLFGNFS